MVVKPGSVFRMRFFPQDGIVPKDASDTWRDKYFVILGKNDEGDFVALSLINTEINEHLKQREDSKSMLVLLDSPAKLNYYIADIPDSAWALLEVAETDGNEENDEVKPLTIIYPNARHLAPNLVAEDGSIGIRITGEPFSKALCAQLKHPLVSTSANISGHPTAHFFHEIEEAILNGADYVCRFRREDETPHEPSSIIKVNSDNTFVIIRQ